MKLRNDSDKTFVGEYNRQTYVIEPNQVVEVPDGAYDVWIGSNEELKRWARQLWGGQLPRLVPVSKKKTKEV